MGLHRPTTPPFLLLCPMLPGRGTARALVSMLDVCSEEMSLCLHGGERSLGRNLAQSSWDSVNLLRNTLIGGSDAVNNTLSPSLSSLFQYLTHRCSHWVLFLTLLHVSLFSPAVKVRE